MDNDKILDRIQKLLALSQGTSSPAEAESAMAKVQELLFQYNLDMADVEAHGTEDERTYDREFAACLQNDWVRSLYQAVATGNLCHTVYEPSTRRVAVIGRPESIAITMYSVSWLVPRLRNMAETYWLLYPGDEREAEFKSGFLVGTVSAIRQRMKAQIQQQSTDSPQGQELMVVSDQRLQAAVKDFYPYLSYGRRGPGVSSEAFGIGYDAGKGVTVQPGVETRNNRLIS